MRWLLLSVVLVVSSVSALETKSDQNKNKGANAKQGTERNPVVVKIHPSENGEQKAAQEKRHEENETRVAVGTEQLVAETHRLSSETNTLVWVTGVLAVFTAFLFGATLVLAKDARRTSERQAGEMQEALKISRAAAKAARASAVATERNVRAMERVAERELRAYVAIKHAFIRLTTVTGPTKALLGKITIANVGKTIAKNVRLALHIDVFDNLSGPFPVAYRPGGTYLHPNIDWNVQQESPEIPSTVKQQLVDGTKYVVMWGELSYFDGFYGVERFTKFRFSQGMLVFAETTTGWDITACEQGNEAT